MYLTLVKGDNSIEPPLRRHIRHWTARFENSLICAAIVGMNIHRSFSNVDKYGMLITLEPRPHEIVGARYNMESCEILSMGEFRAFLTKLGMDAVFAQHEREREYTKKKSGGDTDFAACLVIAMNKGRWKLDGKHNVEARFKPLCILRDMARSPQLNDPGLAWRESLQFQVQQDIPNRHS